MVRKKEVLTLKKEDVSNINDEEISRLLSDKDFMNGLHITPEDVKKQIEISKKQFEEISDYVANYKGTFAELYKELNGWNLGDDANQDNDNLFDCYYKSLLITIYVDNGKLSVSPHDVYIYAEDITDVDTDEILHLDFDKPIDFSKLKITESRKSLGRKIFKKESIQSTADWVTKAKKVLADIKSGNVKYNVYEITSDLEEEIERCTDKNEKAVLTDLLHDINNAYSKIVDKENVREDKKLLMEDDLLGMKKYAEKLKWYINMFTDKDNANDTKMIKQKELDSIIETLWKALEDVPFIENEDGELILDGEYLDFPKGTERETIWHWFDGMYSKGIAYLLYNLDENKKITEGTEEDLDEAFYEKICRAYIDTLNLEWVTTNPENYDSVVHGYFAGDDVAEKYDYGAKVTPDNFKEVVYEDTDQESPVDTDYYEYETWEDFYEDYVKDAIVYDINDIGVYSDGSTDYDEGINHWDFYISEEDLTKLGLWNEDIKSEFIGENKKVVEGYGENVFDKVLSIEDNSGDTIMQFKVANDGNLYGFDNCEVADEEDNLVRIQQIGTFGYDLDESKKVAEDYGGRIFFKVLFQLDDLNLFEVEYKLDSQYKSINDPKIIYTDYFYMNTETLEPEKKDYNYIGFAEDTLKYFREAESFYRKWRNKLSKSITDKEYNELLKDIDVLKTLYNYIETQTKDKLQAEHLSFSFEQEVELSNMPLKN